MAFFMAKTELNLMESGTHLLAPLPSVGYREMGQCPHSGKYSGFWNESEFIFI